MKNHLLLISMHNQNLFILIKVKATVGPVHKLNGSLCNNDQETVDVLNEFFESTFTEEDNLLYLTSLRWFLKICPALRSPKMKYTTN